MFFLIRGNPNGLIFSLIREKRDVAGAFDGAGEFTLEAGADTGDARRKDLAAGREEALEELHVFVIDREGGVRFEGAGFAFCTAEAATAVVVCTGALGCGCIGIHNVLISNNNN